MQAMDSLTAHTCRRRTSPAGARHTRESSDRGRGRRRRGSTRAGFVAKACRAARGPPRRVVVGNKQQARVGAIVAPRAIWRVTEPASRRRPPAHCAGYCQAYTQGPGQHRAAGSRAGCRAGAARPSCHNPTLTRWHWPARLAAGRLTAVSSVDAPQPMGLAKGRAFGQRLPREWCVTWRAIQSSTRATRFRLLLGRSSARATPTARGAPKRHGARAPASTSRRRLASRGSFPLFRVAQSSSAERRTA